MLALTPGGLVDTLGGTQAEASSSRAVKESQIDNAGSQLRAAGVKVRLGPECSQSKKSTLTKTAAEPYVLNKHNKPDLTARESWQNSARPVSSDVPARSSLGPCCQNSKFDPRRHLIFFGENIFENIFLSQKSPTLQESDGEISGTAEAIGPISSSLES